jgi:glyoxylase-like metal-dependent hydrolase (beta-lactamase superfamily II)
MIVVAVNVKGHPLMHADKIRSGLIKFFMVAACVVGSVSYLIAQNLDGVEIKAEPMAPGVAALFGAGGNIGISYGEDGTVLIDDQFAPLTPKIQAAIEKFGASPVKYLINTHWHGDHSGGNENFAKAGATIIAHDNVRIRLATPQTRKGKISEPKPKAALPVITYADGIKLHLNGEQIEVIHVLPAHTDGDSIVFWPKANVMHMGDLFFNKASFPFVDLESGGNANGYIAAAQKALALANSQTKIIPGHGAVAGKAELQAYHDMLVVIIGKVKAAKKAGKSLAQIQAMRPADGYGVAKDGFITADAFVEAVFKSSSKK